MVGARNNVANRFKLLGDVLFDHMGHITNASPNLVFDMSGGHSTLSASIQGHAGHVDFGGYVSGCIVPVSHLALQHHFQLGLRPCFGSGLWSVFRRTVSLGSDGPQLPDCNLAVEASIGTTTRRYG